MWEAVWSIVSNHLPGTFDSVIDVLCPAGTHFHATQSFTVERSAIKQAQAGLSDRQARVEFDLTVRQKVPKVSICNTFIALVAILTELKDQLPLQTMATDIAEQENLSTSSTNISAVFPPSAPSKTMRRPDLSSIQGTVPPGLHPSTLYVDTLSLEIHELTPPMSNASVNQSLGQSDSTASQAAFTVRGDEWAFPLVQPFDSDYEGSALSWENFDFNDLTSLFLGASHPENAEGSAQLPETSASRYEQRAETTDLQWISPTTATMVEHLWFTRLESDNCSTVDTAGNLVSGIFTPGGENLARREINEIYRQNLSDRLRPQWSEEPLPSTEFLVGA